MERPAALPRRPLTIGELLDAAVELVRRIAWPVIGIAVLLALLEQAVLFPVRKDLLFDIVDGPLHGNLSDALGSLWILMAVGLGLEAAIISLLGVNLGVAVAADLSRAPITRGQLLRPRAGHLWAIPIALVCGLLSFAGGFLGPVWILGYGLFGLAGVAIGMERRGPFSALGRAAGMGFRAGMRGTRVRVLGYLAWVLLRIGFYFGLLQLVDYLALNRTGDLAIMIVGLVIANASAYTFLAALDAVTLAELRFRSEGLDIWLDRAQEHGALTPETLAAGR